MEGAEGFVPAGSDLYAEDDGKTTGDPDVDCLDGAASGRRPT